MRRAFLVLGVVLVAGCGGSSERDDVTALVRRQADHVAGVSCSESGEKMGGLPKAKGWNCDLRFADGSKGSCFAITGYGPPAITACRGFTVKPPSTAEVERAMVDGAGGATSAECRHDGARKWRCRIHFADQPDGTGTYEARPDGMSVVGMSSSDTSSPEDP